MKTTWYNLVLLFWWFFILGLTKVPFGDYVLFFLGFWKANPSNENRYPKISQDILISCCQITNCTFVWTMSSDLNKFHSAKLASKARRKLHLCMVLLQATLAETINTCDLQGIWYMHNHVYYIYIYIYCCFFIVIIAYIQLKEVNEGKFWAESLMLWSFLLGKLQLPRLDSWLQPCGFREEIWCKSPSCSACAEQGKLENETMELLTKLRLHCDGSQADFKAQMGNSFGMGFGHTRICVWTYFYVYW